MKHNRSKSKNPRAVRVEQAKAREANASCHLESTRTELKLARKRIGELESEAQGLREKALEKGSSKKLGKDVFLDGLFFFVIALLLEVGKPFLETEFEIQGESSQIATIVVVMLAMAMLYWGAKKVDSWLEARGRLLLKHQPSGT
ncbi:hypothetical protein G3O06_01515 [Burkholderia sp. Ac-20345]|uniref:hypothetical protein n=1 Tax=Burkholderia sp. Ac-20345 TaxID=2703891 RepID=UPI00197BFDEF|nr:hypothetical protein [Burkholderia sp. Ac-20345]MBN3776241.1 hypothetical protein [Burkholderia sp. Ac-20345]